MAEKKEVELIQMYINEDGKLEEWSEESETKAIAKIQKDARKEISFMKQGSATLDPASVKEAIGKQDALIKAITSEFKQGKHYFDIDGVDTPFMGKHGAEMLARIFEITTEYSEVSRFVDISQNIISITAKAKLYHNGVQIYEQIGTTTSMEPDIRKVFQSHDAKTDTWTNKPGKHVIQTEHVINTKARKRAFVLAIRERFGLTDQFGQDPELVDNPKANKTKIFPMYAKLYKYHIDKAPEAPKQKTTRGKKKMLNEKERREWRKEWVKDHVLHPWILKEGISLGSLGIKDVEKIVEAIPTMEVE